jgi:hypothetical protein
MDEFLCEGCGSAIPHTEPAVAVHLSLDWPEETWIRNAPRGWACTSCTGRAPGHPVRTLLDDGLWYPYQAVDPSSPCEGCGHLVALQTHQRRTRVACSNACVLRITTLHSDGKPASETPGQGQGRNQAAIPSPITV